MAVEVEWLGVSGFRIVTEGGVKIYIDPYLDRRVSFNPPPILSRAIRDVDAILITHGHFDHFEDTPKILKQTDAKLIASGELCRFVEGKLGIPRSRLIQLEHDETTDIKGVRIMATKAEHMAKLAVLKYLLNDFTIQPKSREEFMGYEKILPRDLMQFALSVPSGPLQGYFILTETGLRIWNPSETMPIEELKTYSSQLRPQLALIALLGRFEQLCAEVAGWIKPRIIMVHSFDRFVERQRTSLDFEIFRKSLAERSPRTEVIFPRAGEKMIFDLCWKRR